MSAPIEKFIVYETDSVNGFLVYVGAPEWLRALDGDVLAQRANTVAVREMSRKRLLFINDAIQEKLDREKK